MRTLTWIGVLVLVLGILSFVVPVPVNHTRSANVGGASISVTTRNTQKLSPVVGAVLCAAGVVLLIAGSRKAVA